MWDLIINILGKLFTKSAASHIAVGLVFCAATWGIFEIHQSQVEQKREQSETVKIQGKVLAFLVENKRVTDSIYKIDQAKQNFDIDSVKFGLQNLICGVKDLSEVTSILCKEINLPFDTRVDVSVRLTEIPRKIGFAKNNKGLTPGINPKPLN